jgi:3-oxoacyl-[acyl-carrier protein] reductase
MISFELSGKKALVTGGASGIGLGAVELFARSGAQVAINDLPGSPALEREVARLGAEGCDVIAAPADMGDADGVPAMVEAAAAAMGGLDYLVNNAATPNTNRPVPESDFETQNDAFWDKLLSVNLLGPARAIRAAAPHLKASRGAVVNTSSMSAFSGGGSSSVYCATKAALVVMTKEWARGLAPEVRVNAIAPGMVDSNWQCDFSHTPEEVQARVPVGRIGTPEDYAEVIVFLATGAAYVNGTTVMVDGGLNA